MEPEIEGVVELPASVVPSAGINQQIATAHAYPRNLTLFRKSVGEMIAADSDIAKACYYILPRAGTRIQGPSVRLAELCLHFYGNVRIESQVLDIREEDKFVRGRAMAWDLETNVAIAFESLRRVTEKNGRRYSDDVVQSTANAAVSIAIRNAVFKVIPSPLWKPLYDQSLAIVRGDVRTLPERRTLMISDLGKQGITVAQICAVLRVSDIEQIEADHLVIMNGIMQAVADGELTLDSAFAAEQTERRPLPQKISEKRTEQPRESSERQTPEKRTETEQPQEPRQQEQPSEPVQQPQEQLFVPGEVNESSSSALRMRWLKWLVEEATETEFRAIDSRKLSNMTVGFRGQPFVGFLMAHNKRKSELARAGQ
jgi:hypothetical protein